MGVKLKMEGEKIYDKNEKRGGGHDMNERKGMGQEEIQEWGKT